MNNIKILVITPQYAPDFGPSAPIYTALCEDLAKMRYDVTVVTGFPHYGGSNAYYVRPKKLIAEDWINGVHVIRSYVYTISSTSLWLRLLSPASFNFSSTLATARTKKPYVVIADAPSLWSGLPLLLKSIIPNMPFIYVVHDIYPDVLVRLNVFRNSWLIRFIDRIEKFYFSKAKFISVLSKGFQDNLIQKGIPKEKISIVPACTDVEFIHPLPRYNHLRERMQLEDKFVILYAGNIGLSQSLEIVLEAAKILEQFPNFVFAIVGEGATRCALKALAEEKGLENVKFFPFQPRQDVPFLYALADVCLVSLKKNLVVESVPSKTYTIMASGRPIIATVNPNTEVGQLITKVGCGLCVIPENGKALSQAILDLYMKETQLLEMGRRGRDYVVEHYSRQAATSLYDELIRKCIKEH